MASSPLPLSVIVAAPAGAPGVDAMLDAAAAEARGGAPVRVILTDAGLQWLAGGRCARLSDAGIDVAICSRSARASGIGVEGVPAGVRWSSLVAFLRDDAAGDVRTNARLWSAFP